MPFWDWETYCDLCGKKVSAPHGLFCGNFSCKRDNLKVCRRGWCAPCYRAPKALDFYVHQEQNEVSLSWVKRGDERRFQEGIDGAYLMIPFQCDWCWFRCLEDRDPKHQSYQDNRILGYIRRVNLDLIWSRAPGTIASVRDNVKMIIKMWRELGISIDLPSLGPWPIHDRVGFRVALAQVRYSQRPGSNLNTHLQFDSVRKLRTAYSHLHGIASCINDADPRGFKGMKGEVFMMTNCPTDSKFFQHFTRGLLLRLGRQTKSNWGLDVKMLRKN